MTAALTGWPPHGCRFYDRGFLTKTFRVPSRKMHFTMYIIQSPVGWKWARKWPITFRRGHRTVSTLQVLPWCEITTITLPSLALPAYAEYSTTRHHHWVLSDYHPHHISYLLRRSLAREVTPGFPVINIAAPQHMRTTKRTYDYSLVLVAHFFKTQSYSMRSVPKGAPGSVKKKPGDIFFYFKTVDKNRAVYHVIMPYIDIFNTYIVSNLCLKCKTLHISLNFHPTALKLSEINFSA